MEGGNCRERGEGFLWGKGWRAGSAPGIVFRGAAFKVRSCLLGVGKVLLALFLTVEVYLVDMPVAENVVIGTVDLFVF